jgi:hypothetical protein
VVHGTPSGADAVEKLLIDSHCPVAGRIDACVARAVPAVVRLCA